MPKALGLGNTQKTIQVSSDKPLEQLQELYDYAIYLLHNQPDDAPDLLRGIINECNQNVKSHYASEENKDSILVPQFYLIYGSTLREYAIFSMQDQKDLKESINFLNLARDQYEIGIDKAMDAFKVELIVELIALNLYQAGITKDSEMGIYARKLMVDSISDFKDYQVLKLGLDLQKYADQFDDFKSRMEWNDFALSHLTKLEFSKTDDNYLDLMEGIAECFLSKANYYAEQVEKSSDQETSHVCSDCDSAILFLKDGLKWIQKSLDVNENFAKGLATKGEILIYLSDISAQLDNAQDLDQYYKDALDCFKKCHSIDSNILPDEFFGLIEEIED